MLTVVYVDVLLFINIIITYAVLITAEKLLRRSAKTARLIVAAFVGSLFSLTAFIGMDGFFFSLLIKAVSSLLISFIAFSYIDRKEFLKTTLGIICVSVFYSGLFILFYQVFRPPNMAIINDVVYFEFNPLVLLGVTAVIYLIITVLHKIFRERIKNSVVRLDYSIGNESYQCVAKIDTGCNLKEPFSGCPVIIVDKSLTNIDGTEGKRVIPYNTLNSSSILYAVKASNAAINGIPVEKDIYIAVSDIGDNTVKAIINSDIVR